MNVQELESQLSARIITLEDEESRLRDELECLRRLPVIAAEWQVDLSPFREAVENKHSSQQNNRQADLSDMRADTRVGNKDAGPLDHLRERLAKKPARRSKPKKKRKSKPAFSSRIISEARV